MKSVGGPHAARGPRVGQHCRRGMLGCISYFLMSFVPQFTEATDMITLTSVIFPMRYCVYLKKIIASSSNNIVCIQIYHFTHQTMLNQTVYYTIR